MALPSSRIFLRSPYFVKLERAALSRIRVDLYIYTGTLTTNKPATPTFSLLSDAYPLSNGNYFAYVDIAEMARDYVEVSYTGSTSSAAVWIEYDLYYADSGDTSWTLSTSVDLTGLDGYGYFSDGANPTVTDNVFLSSDYIIKPRNKVYEIPVLQDNLTRFILARGGAQLYNSGALSTTENTANVIYYADTELAPTADRAIFKFSGGIADKVINIRYEDECKNDAVLVTFVNRYGALQDLWFFGRDVKKITTTDDIYKRNLISAGTYNTKRHQDTVMNKNAKDTITLNSGYYPEDAEGSFRELLLSEQVWITYPSEKVDGFRAASADVVYPVRVKTSDLTWKTSQYDKLINYAIDFEIANDKINSVR